MDDWVSSAPRERLMVWMRRVARPSVKEVLQRLGPLNIVGVGLAALYGLPSVWYPFGNDQGLHWYAGTGMLRGDLPYVTVISSKPLGSFLNHTLAVAIFGDSQASIRILELLTVLFAGWLIARLIRDPDLPRVDGDVGLGAIVAVGVHYTFFDYWDTAHPETWEGIALIGAAVVAFRDPKPVRRAMLTGALVGLAFMIKFPAALAGLVPAGIVGWRAMTEQSPPRWLRLITSAGLFLAGVAIVIGLCVLPFAVTGQLGPMWEILYGFVAKIADDAPRFVGVPRWLFPDRGGVAMAVSLALLGVGLALARERRNRRQLLVGVAIFGLWLLGLQGIRAQGRYIDYHWMVIAPCLAAMAVWGLRQLWPRGGPAPLLAAVALIAIAFLMGPRWGSYPEFDYRQHIDRVLAYTSGEMDRAAFVDAYRGLNRLDRYGPMEEVAAIIDAHKRDGDTLCLRGFPAPIYQLTGLRCPSRHIVEEEVAMGLAGWRAEYERELAAHPPTFVVTFADRPTDLVALGRNGYQDIGRVGLFVVLERR
jgi:hypothetical protein